MNELQIRSAGMKDLDAILTIQALCYTEVEPESAQSMGAKLAAAPDSCFVAEYQGSVVAYLLSLPWLLHQLPTLNNPECQLPQQPDCFYLHDLAVAPVGRKLGAGRALIQAFFTALTQAGLDVACLVAVQGSGDYWQRWGFVVQQPDAELQHKLNSYGEGVEYRVWSRESVGSLPLDKLPSI